jgi:endonuclease/exonuclease/phosphatase family metal-dependent hydrolase
VASQRLRLVTFNIAHGRGLTPIQGLTSSRKLRLNLRRISDLLGKLGADLVALQEIDECSIWAGSFDHLDYLRAHAGFPHAAFGINNRRVGLMNLCYGNAILSRYPIEETETIVFGKSKVGEKGFLFTEINVGGRVVPVVNLHLHFSSRKKRMSSWTTSCTGCVRRSGSAAPSGRFPRSSAATSTRPTRATTRRPPSSAT